MFREIQGRKDLFSSAMAFAGPFVTDLSGNGQASIAQGETVSGNYFETLGVRAALAERCSRRIRSPELPLLPCSIMAIGNMRSAALLSSWGEVFA
jgi:hypothetical protein